MKKLNVCAALLLAGVLCASLMPLSASAEGTGKASYFGKTVDEATLQNDEALKNMGFDEADISALRKGEDVIYSVKYEMSNPQSYEQLAENSAAKLKIDAFYGGKSLKPADSLLTSYSAVRVRGTQAPETLDNIKNVSGTVKLGLLESQGNAADFVKNGNVTMLYLAGDTAVRTDAKATPEGTNAITVDFNYLGSGDYIVLYESVAPASGTEGPEGQNRTESATAASGTGKNVPGSGTEVTGTLTGVTDSGTEVTGTLTGVTDSGTEVTGTLTDASKSGSQTGTKSTQTGTNANQSGTAAPAAAGTTAPPPKTGDTGVKSAVAVLCAAMAVFLYTRRPGMGKRDEGDTEE